MRSLIRLFIYYPIWGYVLLFAVLILGLVSLSNIKRGFFPERKVRNVTIQVNYPGASPEEMEEGITLKVEESLKGIEGIEEVTSVSRENNATINVIGLIDADPEKLLADVKNAVDRINAFPVGAEKPIVFQEKAEERAISLVLHGGTELKNLKRFADQIEYDLLASGLISQVKIQGLPPLELSVEVSEDNLRRYGLRFDELAAALRGNNLDLSGGSIKSDKEELLIRSRAKSHNPLTIGELVLRQRPDGSVLRVRDVATVKEQFADQPSKTIYNGKRAVTIQISKLPEEDILKITDFAHEYAETFSARHAPMTLTATNDRSTIIRQRIELLLNNGITGLLLVLLTLSLFLNLRLAFWVALSIPVAFAGMFVIALFAGITINVLSLFGMILVIGILVDDGIVIGENIFTHYEEGSPPIPAALNGSMEVFPSVFASVTTTIVMFVALFFLEGRMGEAMWEMALVVVACLSFSLVEGALLLPEHLAHSLPRRDEKPSKVRQTLDRGIDFLRFKLYGGLLRRIVHYPYVALAIVFFLALSVVGLMAGGIIKSTFFPFVDSDEITINLTMKPGTRETQTQAILSDIEKKVWTVNREFSAKREDSLQYVLSTRIDINELNSEEGTLQIELLDGETRNLESFVLSQAIREAVGEIPEADKFTVGTNMIFGKPVVLSVVGLDLRSLEQARKFLRNELEQFPQLKDVTDNQISGKREIDIRLKPLAYSMGLTTLDVVRQIRQGFFGEEVQRLQIGKDEVRVWVRYTPEDRRSLGQLEQAKLRTPDGREFPLNDLIEYNTQRSVVTINHFQGTREVRVEADLADPNEPVPPLLSKIKEEVIPKLQTQVPGVQVKFEGQDKENRKFQESLMRSFPYAFAGLIVILMLTLRSVSQPLLIILLIPLAILGAFAGHGIEGKPISVFSAYGLIALMGVVVNDSVVFIDKYNSLLRAGYSVREAVHLSGTARFRAIVLTSVTTVAGLYPLILEKSRQAQFLIPMAISVAWGLAFATFLTLLLLPALLLIANDVRVGLRWLWTGQRPSPESVEPAVKEIRRLEHAEADDNALQAKGHSHNQKNMESTPTAASHAHEDQVD